jgi:hypothetical protein
MSMLVYIKIFGFFILSIVYFYSKTIESNFFFQLFVIYLSLLAKLFVKLASLYISIIDFLFLRRFQFFFSCMFIFQYFDFFWQLYLQMIIIICLVSCFLFPFFFCGFIYFKNETFKIISTFHLRFAVLLVLFFSNQMLMAIIIISDLCSLM